MKKTALFIIILTIFANIGFADAKLIQKYEEKIPISKSITLYNVKEFHTDKKISYSYIKADLRDPSTSLTLLKSEKGSDVLTTVSDLAQTEKDVVAALNADFFSVHSGNKGFSLGIEIKDGELIESPINPSTMATISYINSQVSMSYLDFHIMVVAPNWQYNEIRHLNKHTAYYGDILMYTSDFNGGMSPAPGGEVLEVVVSDGKITEFRRNMPPVKIPEDGCVLVVSEGVNMFFANNFNIGDPIKFDYYITPDIKNAETAFGGGAMLVSNGVAVTDWSHVIAGNNPRSAIGIDKEGKTLYLVAVDGRQEGSIGMRMSHLSDLLVSLGCYNAVNLDGGGSTNMIASTLYNDSLHTVNSPTENRKVINAIGITSKTSSGKVSGIDIKADKETTFLMQPVTLNCTLYDENMRKVAGDATLSSSYGIIDKNKFYPTVPGKVYVKASYNNIVKELEIDVKDTIAGIDVPGFISINPGETKTLDISAYDKNGNYDKITNTDFVNISSSNPSVIEVKGNKIISHGKGSSVISVSRYDIQSFISVTSGEDTDITVAPLNIYDGMNPYDYYSSVKIGSLITSENTIISQYVNNALSRQISEASHGALIGNTKGFKTKENGNSLFINIDTKKGGINKTDSSQWGKITDAIEKSKKSNIFILSESSIFGDDEFENRVICDYLSSLGKNVFVVTSADKNTAKNIKGVYYFTIGNNIKAKLNNDKVQNYTYLEIDTASQTPSFKWVSLF